MPKPVSEKSPVAVGCHVFAGGFTVGVRAAGFRVPCHLEDGRFGADTVRLNMPGVALHQDPASWPLADLRDKVDLVFCNPPCSPWSTAGIVRGQTTEQQCDWRAHPACKHTASAFSLLRELRPKVWTTESVRQVYTKGGAMLDDMAREALALGYDVHDLFVEAKDFGVPQHRRRYFMVCSRVRVDWRPPVRDGEPTVYGALAGSGADDDVLLPLPDTVESVVRSVAQGENVGMVWDREVAAGRAPPTKRPGFLYDRMRGDRPSYTILGACHKLHPDEDRFLTVNEAKAVCGFPAGYKIVGSGNQRFAQLGKGVCPPVARWLAGEVSAALSAARPVSSPARRFLKVESVRPTGV